MANDASATLRGLHGEGNLGEERDVAREESGVTREESGVTRGESAKNGASLVENAESGDDTRSAKYDLGLCLGNEAAKNEGANDDQRDYSILFLTLRRSLQMSGAIERKARIPRREI